LPVGLGRPARRWRRSDSFACSRDAIVPPQNKTVKPQTTSPGLIRLLNSTVRMLLHLPKESSQAASCWFQSSWLEPCSGIWKELGLPRYTIGVLWSLGTPLLTKRWQVRALHPQAGMAGPSGSNNYYRGGVPGLGYSFWGWSWTSCSASGTSSLISYLVAHRTLSRTRCIHSFS
jgi:hypothetical protein